MRPVPPLEAASVPVSVNVPAEVIGLPIALRPVVPPEKLTLVTVPEPGPPEFQLTFNPSVVRNLPVWPVCAGRRLLIAVDAVVAPVPPLATFSVPPSVIAPTFAPVGGRPVVPAENDVTPEVLPPIAQETLPLPSVVRNFPPF